MCNFFLQWLFLLFKCSPKCAKREKLFNLPYNGNCSLNCLLFLFIINCTLFVFLFFKPHFFSSSHFHFFPLANPCASFEIINLISNLHDTITSHHRVRKRSSKLPLVSSRKNNAIKLCFSKNPAKFSQESTQRHSKTDKKRSLKVQLQKF